MTVPDRVIERLCFASAPALYAAVWLSAGILLFPYVARHGCATPGMLLCATAALAVLSALAATKATRIALFPLAATWLMLGLLLSNIAPDADPQVTLRQIADGGGPVRIEGVVTRINPVRVIESSSPYGGAAKQEQSESLDVRVVTANGTAVGGGVRATAYAPVDAHFPAIKCGDHLQAQLMLHPPERYVDPGVWDATAWLRTQGVGVIGSVKAAQLTLTPGSDKGSFLCRLHAAQEAGSQKLADLTANPAVLRLPPFLRLSPTDAGMLAAMVLGDRTYLEQQDRVGFERTGSFHLLVVSGMHLAIFAGCIFFIAARLHLSQLWSTALTIICSFAYAVLTGFGEPVQRSFWMVALYFLARLFLRQRNSLNAVGFAAVCLLAFDPHSLAGASFQMTLLSALIGAGIALPITEHSFGPYLQAARNLKLTAIDPSLPQAVAQFRVTLRRIARELALFMGKRASRLFVTITVRVALRACELLLVSTLIELAMSLPMALYFHRVTALGLPVNLLVVPLIGLALPAALCTFAILLVTPALAWVPAAATAGLLHTITSVVHAFSGMTAGDLRIPGPNLLIIASGIFLIGFAIWAARNSRFPILLPMAALAASATCVLIPQRLDFHPGVLEVTAIDVGQGDSLLLISPEGKTLLVDSGGPTGGAQEAHGNFEIGEDVVSPVLWSRHLRRLDAVALTHAHSDHMGGMIAVLRNFRPRMLWVGNNPPSPAYEALLEEAQRLGVSVVSMSAGDQRDFGGTHVEVLAPPPGYIPGHAASNDDSLVMRVSYRHTSVLLEGDAQAGREQQMLGQDLHADLLKVGHHGSKTSTTPQFLAAVSPRYAVVSVAHHNGYGHPKREVLARLQDAGIQTFRTDALGATSFYLDGNSLQAQPIAAR